MVKSLPWSLSRGCWFVPSLHDSDGPSTGVECPETTGEDASKEPQKGARPPSLAHKVQRDGGIARWRMGEELTFVPPGPGPGGIAASPPANTDRHAQEGSRRLKKAQEARRLKKQEGIF